jgi:N-acetylmuramoyl-L-alanine amidase
VNAWNPVFEKYFADEKQNIIDWKNERQKESKALMADGKIKYVPDMALHSNVTPEVSVKLYGMNKWANENNIDLVVNLHFNDSIRPNMNFPGQFRGFTIFIPENQMKNSAASRLAAQDVFNELKKVEPPELDNLLEDQSLIALGASGTLNPPSMLIEYAYIYEKELLSETERGKTLDQMAQQTVLGIEDYFNDLSDNK